MTRVAPLIVLSFFVMGVTRCNEPCGPATEAPSGTYQGYEPDLEGDEVINASTATFIDDEHQEPVVLDGANKVCVWKGLVTSDYPLDSSWNYMHESTAGRNHGGVELNDLSTLQRMVIEKVADGVRFRPGADGSVIHDNKFQHIFDDCLDDHEMQGMTAQFNLFEGCYVWLSARPNDSQNGNSKTLKLDWNIARLQGNPQPHPTEQEDTEYGSGGVSAAVANVELSSRWKQAHSHAQADQRAFD